MGKHKRIVSGFSNTKPLASKNQTSGKTSDHVEKEQHAVALINRGELKEAELIYRELISEGTKNHIVFVNLAAICGNQGKFDELIELLENAIELNPNFAETHNNLGNALKEQGKLSAAIASYNKALQLKPNFPDAYFNLGNALQEQGDLAAAIASYNTVLQLQPNYPEAHWHSAWAFLLGGDYKNGWEKYEWRTKKEQGDTSQQHAKPKCGLWDGSKLNKKSPILLVSEQGLGDTLQFMRYAIKLKELGYSVSICAQPNLHGLITTSDIDSSPLTPQEGDEVREGKWLPLLSLPRHLKVSPENPIITEPYIKTKEELNEKWKAILSTEHRPIIGINWQGNPSAEKGSYKGRSLPLETFAPVADKVDVCLLSLQKGFGSEQLETCSFKDRFVGCQDQINDTWDFLETAAIIANCDLVITSDTSVAHLAGGMGKTTWVLLKQVPEWRWGLDGESTFWYPAIRLFRQNENGNWSEVMERVVEALQQHCWRSKTPAEAPKTPQHAIKPEPAREIWAPISLGELIDKITILQIKTNHVEGTALENVRNELEALESELNSLQINISPPLIKRLKQVNQDLWQIEDDIRDQEQQKDFGATFIRLARSIYQHNDQRAAIKKEINTTYGSYLVEEKSYRQH